MRVTISGTSVATTITPWLTTLVTNGIITDVVKADVIAQIKGYNFTKDVSVRMNLLININSAPQPVGIVTLPRYTITHNFDGCIGCDDPGYVTANPEECSCANPDYVTDNPDMCTCDDEDYARANPDECPICTDLMFK